MLKATFSQRSAQAVLAGDRQQDLVGEHLFDHAAGLDGLPRAVEAGPSVFVGRRTSRRAPARTSARTLLQSRPVAARSARLFDTWPKIAGSRNAWATFTLCQSITSLSQRAVRRCVFRARSSSQGSPVRL